MDWQLVASYFTVKSMDIFAVYASNEKANRMTDSAVVSKMISK